jgi:hypothetical protein
MGLGVITNHRQVIAFPLVVFGKKRDFSSVARDLLVEAVKMKNYAGIIFADGPTGRRARVSGKRI